MKKMFLCAMFAVGSVIGFAEESPCCNNVFSDNFENSSVTHPVQRKKAPQNPYIVPAKVNRGVIKFLPISKDEEYTFRPYKPKKHRTKKPRLRGW